MGHIQMNDLRTLVLTDKNNIYKGLVMGVAEPASQNQYCVFFFLQHSQQDMVFLPPLKLMPPFPGFWQMESN